MYKTTIVSFYFDITTFEDATTSIRPASFYMDKGRSIMRLPYPMIFFCDDSTYETVKKIRDEELGQERANDLTHYVIKNIKDYDFYKDNFSVIQKNRTQYASVYKNSRNTTSYFLLTMFKILALKIADNLNRFDTPYYAWIDFGGSHIMRNFDDSAKKMCDHPLEKIRFCYIHYRGKEELRDMKRYYANGGPCGVAATAFTVQREYISQFYTGILSIFYETLFHGVGHSEEGIMTYFCDRYPDLCNYSYGDYYSVLANYQRPVEDIHAIQHFFINKCKSAHREDLAIKALCAIHNSI